jgi:hypothetical protein
MGSGILLAMTGKLNRIGQPVRRWAALPVATSVLCALDAGDIGQDAEHRPAELMANTVVA